VPPDYQAANAGSNLKSAAHGAAGRLRRGHRFDGVVTEVFTKHELITPFDRFGVR
jgi:hypothetical protein